MIWLPSRNFRPSKRNACIKKSSSSPEPVRANQRLFMSILIKSDTKVLIQGITGSFGARHAQLSIDYGTQVVAGVTPGKGGQTFEHNGKKVPAVDTVADAVKQTGATAY